MHEPEKHLTPRSDESSTGLPDGAGVVIGVGLGALIWFGLAMLVF